MAEQIRVEEFVDNDTVYIREIYDNGSIVEYIKPDHTSEPVRPRLTENELIQAEILLNQVDIIAKQNEQDEVLAAILLNQMEV